MPFSVGIALIAVAIVVSPILVFECKVTFFFRIDNALAQNYIKYLSGLLLMMKNLIDKPLKLLIGKGVVEFTQGFGQSAVVPLVLLGVLGAE